MAKCWRAFDAESLVLLYVLVFVSAVEALNVSYDQRAFLLDGKRRLLISAGIHYPRATPEMWPNLIAKAKEGGANVIETYVFWNGHEPRKGEYNFDGRYNLPQFVQLVGEAGMYVTLRIGPYVCAEWNFGGFPVWLRDVPGIEFRTNNEPFKDEMECFTKVIVEILKGLKLFAWQGGPIIMAQIENEYGNIGSQYGAQGKEYVKWAANMAQNLGAGVPWFMCQQNDAPLNVINTCNGYYCDGWKPNAPGRPTMWTEDWDGWFQNWGSTVPHRPAEDAAFAVARFYQRGGTYQNYYMYFGGTNFERTAGGPLITTSYDYDGPLDEYGLVREPKWGHLKELHAVLMLCEPALMSVDNEPEYIRLGPNQEAHVYTTTADPKVCAAFLANIDSGSSALVEFRGQKFELPPWSVSILPDCKTVVYNTAKVRAQTSVVSMRRNSPNLRPADSDSLSDCQVASNWCNWELQEEPIGIRDNGTFTALSLREQIRTTGDSTDYLWYTTRFQVSKNDLEELQRRNGEAHLVLEAVRDALHMFVNGDLVGSATGWWFRMNQSITLKEGFNEIALLCMTVGIQNYGAFLEKDGAGIKGKVLVQGLASGVLDLTHSEWVYQVGLKGEELQFFSDTGSQSDSWAWATLPVRRPLTWYKSTFDSPYGRDPVALDLGSMGKGQVWVNGNLLGRYWTLAAPENGCGSCDYRGPYHAAKCATGCGKPTQRWYHIPREWLREYDNVLVLFEEVGGDPSSISVVTRSPDSVCAHVSDTDPPHVDRWATLRNSLEVGQLQQALLPEVRLECSLGQQISQIVYASFGNSSGTCGNFRKGNCHSSNSQAVVEKACLGRRFCSIPVSPWEFGEDSCSGVSKMLTVQALCRGANELTTEIRSHDDTSIPLGLYSSKWQRFDVRSARGQEIQPLYVDT